MILIGMEGMQVTFGQPFNGKATIEQFGAETKVIIPVKGKTSRVIYTLIFFAFYLYVLINFYSRTPLDDWRDGPGDW